MSFAMVTILGNGFILTALLWSSATVFIIEQRFGFAAVAFVVASAATLCGLTHSPLVSGSLFWPWAPWFLNSCRARLRRPRRVRTTSWSSLR